MSTNTGRTTDPGRAWWRASVAVHALGLLVLLVLGIAYLVLSLELPRGTLSRPEEGLFPRMIGLLLIVSAAVALVATRRATPESTSFDEDEPEEHDFGEAAWRVPAVAGAVILYVVLAPLAGHLVVGALLTFLVLLVLSARPFWQSALVSVAFAFGTYALFTVLLDVALPAGRWWA